MASMVTRTFLILVCVFLLSQPYSVNAQDLTSQQTVDKAFIDSLVKAGIVRDTLIRSEQVSFTKGDALIYLQKWIQPFTWKNLHDPLRTALVQLVFEASHQPYDSAELFLKKYPFDSIAVPREKFFIWEPAHAKISDTGKDTTLMVAVDTVREVISSFSGFPFRFYRYPFQSDSIKAAANVLLDYLRGRDSTVVKITGVSGHEIPLWLNSKSEMMLRYWLRNDLNDSVTVWVGNPSRNTIGLYLENGVVFRRPSMQGNISKARIDVQNISRNKLLDIHKIPIRIQFWKFHTESALGLSQGYLSNWVKGGESSISTSIDITGFADYNNKPMLVSSDNYIRLKYGLIASPSDGIRKNLDLLETNSKLNHKAFGKFDFSAILLFKTQVSKGYNYPNDTVPVSKFMNPAMLTLGLGLDYKPDKHTSINFSPLSYKLTLVTDTGTRPPHIDQTLYGVPKSRKALHEPGVSLIVVHEFSPVKNMNVTNRLQLFTNYIHNPLNIDVDWETIITTNLNWFTDVRLNTHLIFDDDTKTPVFDRDKNPVLDATGLQKKTARIQFKELLGLSFVFRF